MVVKMVVVWEVASVVEVVVVGEVVVGEVSVLVRRGVWPFGAPWMIYLPGGDIPRLHSGALIKGIINAFN